MTEQNECQWRSECIYDEFIAMTAERDNLKEQLDDMFLLVASLKDEIYDLNQDIENMTYEKKDLLQRYQKLEEEYNALLDEESR